jgi:putative endopeptidase
MKSMLLGAAAIAALLTATAHAESAPAAPVAAAAATPNLTAAKMGSWGFDLSGRDTAKTPGDNFYDFANGLWDARTEIPADRARYGAFDALRELSDARSLKVIQTAATLPAAKGEAQQVGALYASFMDEARIAKLDAQPLTPYLAAVKAAKSHEAIAALMGKSSKGFGSSVFGVYIGQEAKDPNTYAVYLGQAGLGLPDRDYYLTEQFADKKAKYQVYVAAQLKAAGWAEPEKNAAAIVALETAIAKVSWSKIEQRDPVAGYNPMPVADLVKLAPDFPWASYLTATGLKAAGTVIVGEKSAFPKIAKIFADTPVATLQAWMAFNLVNEMSPYLSPRFVDARFDFVGKTLSGQPMNRPRWKRGVGIVDSNLGEAVGKLYIETFFPAESKTKMVGLVSDLRTALKARIENLTWMGSETKAKALEKLSTFTVKIAYPDRWRDYSALTVKPDDLVGNVARSTAFQWAFEVNRLNGPVDRMEWGMFPQTVNAYYNPQMNEIVFPAAILQSPFFDPDADPAINYGGIGGFIGHEITHGFDDQGRQFAADGSLNDWWQPADAAKFKVQTDRLDGQYSAFEPLPGAKVQGQLTMGENIADLGGLLTALDAYKLSLKGQPSPVIDGLTGDQRVFLGWAQVWRTKSRDDALRQQIASDPHSPPRYRVNGVVRNMDAWYEAFGVKPGDALYVAPENRVRIW